MSYSKKGALSSIVQHLMTLVNKPYKSHLDELLLNISSKQYELTGSQGFFYKGTMYNHSPKHSVKGLDKSLHSLMDDYLSTSKSYQSIYDTVSAYFRINLMAFHNHTDGLIHILTKDNYMYLTQGLLGDYEFIEHDELPNNFHEVNAYITKSRILSSL